MRAVRLALAALLLAAPGGAGESGLREKRQDLKELNQKIRQNKEAVQVQERQEQGLLQELEQANRELDAARRVAAGHQKDLDRVRARLKAVQARLAALQGEEAVDRAALKSGLASLYKARSRRGLSMLFSARSPAELRARARYLQALGSATRRRVASLRAGIRQQEGFRRENQEKARELNKLLADLELDRRKVEKQRSSQQTRLQRLRRDKAKTLELGRELESQRVRLQGLLEGLQARSRARPAPGPQDADSGVPLRTGLPWPLQGKLVSQFGRHPHPIFGTPVFNRGIEIKAPYGSPVRAVAEGKVLHAASMEGYGGLVVLDHGQGLLSVYGYGSQLLVKAGQRVAQGEVVQEVGQSGTLGTSALYFEIRQGFRAQDPLRYLAKR